MKSDLQDKLFEKYPKLFVQKDLDMTQTAMCFGIETPDEWFDIIDKLCQTIQNNIDWNKLEQVQFTQVKEKWGSLRVYYYPTNDWIDGVIALAEAVTQDESLIF